MEYLLHLAKDEQLKKPIHGHQPLIVEKRKDILFYLCASIMSQQLSTKVADSIKQRFLALYDGRIPEPREILDTPVETLRSIGLSNAKVSYVCNVARFAIEKGLDPEVLHQMDNEEIITYLTQIKGVGRWTVEMLLMFALGREDVFAIDDWGIQNAMLHIYQLDRTDKKAFRQALLTISQKWSPYRTYACMHLWRWKDNSPLTAAAKNTPAKTTAPAKKRAAAPKTTHSDPPAKKSTTPTNTTKKTSAATTHTTNSKRSAAAKNPAAAKSSAPAKSSAANKPATAIKPAATKRSAATKKSANKPTPANIPAATKRVAPAKKSAAKKSPAKNPSAKKPATAKRSASKKSTPAKSSGTVKKPTPKFNR